MKKLLNISTLLTSILLMSTAYGKQEQPFVIITPTVTEVSSDTMEYKPGVRFKKDPSILDEETRIKLVNKAKAKRAHKAKKSTPNYKVQLTQGATTVLDTTNNLLATAYNEINALIESTPSYIEHLIQLSFLL